MSLMCLLSLSHADGVGVRGGGDTIGLLGSPALRDLHDNTVCTWKDMNGILASTPALQNLLSKVEQKAPYLAFKIKFEFYNFRVCFTEGTLNPLPPTDLAVLTTYQEPRGQVAVRIDHDVYVDSKLFRDLPEAEQAVLYVHEASHAFISMNTSGHSAKLRSFVKMLDAIETVSEADILANMDGNEIKLGWISPQNWQALGPVLSYDHPYQDSVAALEKVVALIPYISINEFHCALNTRTGLYLDEKEISRAIKDSTALTPGQGYRIDDTIDALMIADTIDLEMKCMWGMRGAGKTDEWRSHQQP